MCGQEALLNFTNGKYVVFYLARAQPLPSSCFYEVSIHRGETFQPEAHLSPASTCFYKYWGKIHEQYDW